MVWNLWMKWNVCYCLFTVYYILVLFFFILLELERTERLSVKRKAEEPVASSSKKSVNDPLTIQQRLIAMSTGESSEILEKRTRSGLKPSGIGFQLIAWLGCLTRWIHFNYCSTSRFRITGYFQWSIYSRVATWIRRTCN